MDAIKGIFAVLVAVVLGLSSLLFTLIWNGFWIVASILAFAWAFDACFGGN